MKSVAVLSRVDDMIAQATRLVVQVDDIDPALLGTLQPSAFVPLTLRGVVTDADVRAALASQYPDYTIYLNVADRNAAVTQLLVDHGFGV